MAYEEHRSFCLEVVKVSHHKPACENGARDDNAHRPPGSNAASPEMFKASNDYCNCVEHSTAEGEQQKSNFKVAVGPA